MDGFRSADQDRRIREARKRSFTNQHDIKLIEFGKSRGEDMSVTEAELEARLNQNHIDSYRLDKHSQENSEEQAKNYLDRMRYINTVNKRVQQHIENKRKHGVGATLGDYKSRYSDRHYWAHRVDPVGIQSQQYENSVKKAVADIANFQVIASDQDLDYLAAYMVAEEKRKNQGATQTAFDIASMLPVNMIGFGAGAVAAKPFGKMIAKAGFKESIKGGVRSSAKYAVGKSVQLGAQTVFNTNVLAKNLGSRVAPKVFTTIGKDGEWGVMVEGGENLLDALPYAFAESFIDNSTEHLGRLMPIKKKRAIANKLFKSNVVSKYAASKGFNLKEAAEKVGEALERGGFHGIIGEMIEERAGEIAKGATGLSDDFGVTEQMLDPKTRGEAKKQLLAEFMAFAVPGAARKVARSLSADKPVETRKTEQTEAGLDWNVDEEPTEPIAASPANDVDSATGMADSNAVASDSAEKTKDAKAIDSEKVQNAKAESVKTKDIKLDPERFEFKEDVDRGGVPEKIEGESRPVEAGSIVLWEDEGGQKYVVSGHQEFELAQRANQDSIDGVVLRASDGVSAEKAIAIGSDLRSSEGQRTRVENGLGDHVGVDQQVGDQELEMAPNRADSQRGPNLQLGHTELVQAKLIDSEDENAKPINAAEIMKTMEREFEVKFVHRLKGKALGTFATKSHTLRLTRQETMNLGVGSHELAHKISKDSKIRANAPVNVKRELKALDYEPAAGRPEEGWAEFFRIYVTYGKDVAKNEAPVTFDWFESQWLPANQEYKTKIDHLYSMIKRFRSQSTEDHMLGTVQFDGKPVRAIDVPVMEMIKEGLLNSKASEEKGVIHKVYQQWKDEGWFIDLFEKDARSKGTSWSKGESPKELYAFFNQAGPTMADLAITEGVFSLSDFKKIGPSLRDVFGKIAPSDYKKFVAFAYARHAMEVWEKKDINPGVPESVAKQYYQKHVNPTWEEAAGNLKAFHDGLIDVQVEAGLISEDTANVVKESWKTYVPLVRERESLVSRIRGRSGIEVSSELHGRKGSGLRVIDPIRATIERAVSVYTKAAQQEVNTRLITTATKTENMGRWITHEPALTKSMSGNIGAVWKQIRDSLIKNNEMSENELPENVSDAVASELITLYQNHHNYKGDQPIVRVMIEGKPQLFRLDPDLYKSIGGMERTILPWFVDATFGLSARLVRMGATGVNPKFTGSNFVRDVNTFLFQKEHTGNRIQDLASPVTMVGAYVNSQINSFANKEGDPYVRIWQQFGGELGTPIGLDRRGLNKKISEITDTATRAKVERLLKKPINTLQSIINVSEVGPRLAEFKSVLNNAGWDKGRIKREGLPPRSLIIQAINAANDVTTNFKRNGTIGKWINQLVPFFNARLEGSDKFVRTWKNHPKESMFKSAVAVSIMFLYWLSVKDDDEYEEEPDWLKYNFFTIKDSRGRTVAKIPRGHDWNTFVLAPAQSMFDAINKKDPEAIKKQVQRMAGTEGTVSTSDFLMENTVALFKPAWESSANFDSFRNKEIHSTKFRNLEPRDQYGQNTSQLMRHVGDYLNVSPAHLDHLAQGYSGGLYKTAMKTANPKSVADLPFVNSFLMSSEYSKSPGELYEKLDAIDKQYQSMALNRKRKEKSTGEEIEPSSKEKELKKELSRLKKYRKAMWDISSFLRDSKDDELKFKMNRIIAGTAREALGKRELKSFPSITVANDSDLSDEFLPIKKDLINSMKDK